MTTKARSVRIPEGLADEADLVARARGISFNQLVTESLHREVAAAKADVAFMDQVRQLAERDRAIIERLAAQ